MRNYSVRDINRQQQYAKIRISRREKYQKRKGIKNEIVNDKRTLKLANLAYRCSQRNKTRGIVNR